MSTILKKSIYICGFMGCGKSKLAQNLAKTLHVTPIDLDRYIIWKAQLSIPEIFERYGEDYFREMEEQALLECRRRHTIIACGGGTMLSKRNVEIAKRQGYIVFLDQTFEVCYDRIQNDTNRPLVKGQSKAALQQLFEERHKIYCEHATITVPAGNTPEESAERVLNALGLESILTKH